MKDNLATRFRPVRAFVGLALVLLLLQGAVAVMSDPPPSWSPPEIHKHADSTQVGVGGTVEFVVTVANPTAPPDPLVPVTWYEVQMTDVLSPSLTLDDLIVTGDYDDHSVDGNTVTVTAAKLEPGESFVITMTCTIATHPGPGQAITNVATLVYEDETGDPGEPLTSDPVTVAVSYRVMLPILYRNY
jgi:fimbrial isopeptide formation D2 family protein